MASITKTDVRDYIAKGQADTIVVRRHRTKRTRRGIIGIAEERRPVSNVEFVYITGWRIPSEVLPLEWRVINFDEKLSPRQRVAGTIRLDAGTTKNGEGRGGAKKV